MSGTDFLDTNILVYAVSADAVKAERAERLLASGGVVSVQVLNEFAAVMVRKFGFGVAEVREMLEAVRAVCRVVPLDIGTHEGGLALAERHRLPIYDSMIAAAAIDAGCDTLWSEDFQDGFVIGPLSVRNPFAAGA